MILGRGLYGGALVALLLMAAGVPCLAQTPTAATTPATTPGPATAAKPAPAKAAAKNLDPAKKIAAAKKKAEPKKIAGTAKNSQDQKSEAKKIAAVRKKPALVKLAPIKLATVKLAPAAPKPAAASYTITTTRDHVTYTATRVVPVPAAAPPAAAPPAAAPPAKVAVATPPAAKAAEAAPAVAPPRAESVAVLPVKAVTPAKSEAQPPAAATGPPDANAATFVATFLRDAFRIARSAGESTLQRRAQLADLFSSKMDISGIAGYTTSDELTGTSPEFQRRFRTVLISYLVETYYPRLKLASDPSVRVETTPAPSLADGTAVVWTKFSKEGWGSQSVKWHLMAGNGGYKVVDIISAGASVMQMERDTFISVMRDGGLPELMAKLDARTKSLALAAVN
jgi:ABC-type transporter MlaC component